MRTLDRYLTHGVATRRDAALLSVLAGAVTGALFQALGVGLKGSFIACFLAAGTVEIIAAYSYEPNPHPRPKKTDRTEFDSKVLMAVVLVMICGVLRARFTNVPDAIVRNLGKAAAESQKGNVDQANRRMQQVSLAISRLSKSQVKMSPSFFNTTISTFGKLDPRVADSQDTFRALVQLAEYRTQVVEKPNREVKIGYLHRDGQFTYLRDAYLLGPDAIHNSSFGTDIDGFVLDNVIFENTVIVYRGGPVSFHNVTFINCRFEVSNSSDGRTLLASVAQQSADIEIGTIPPRPKG